MSSAAVMIGALRVKAPKKMTKFASAKFQKKKIVQILSYWEFKDFEGN